MKNKRCDSAVRGIDPQIVGSRLLEKGLGVPVQELDWERVQQSGGGPIAGQQTSAALPAIAGVV